MVGCNELSSLMWSLREKGMSSPLRQSHWTCRGPCSLSHPPASKDACLGFPSDLLSHPLSWVHPCEPGRGHHSIQLCLPSVLGTHHLALGPHQKALSATESGEAASPGLLCPQ